MPCQHMSKVELKQHISEILCPDIFSVLMQFAKETMNNEVYDETATT